MFVYNSHKNIRYIYNVALLFMFLYKPKAKFPGILLRASESEECLYISHISVTIVIREAAVELK